MTIGLILVQSGISILHGLLCMSKALWQIPKVELGIFKLLSALPQMPSLSMLKKKKLGKSRDGSSVNQFET